MEEFRRRSFLQKSGTVATGLAVTLVPAAGLAATATPAEASVHDRLGDVIAHPTDELAAQPVMAYIHNAKRGEVTIVAGDVERTYRDHALTKRLLDAASNARND